MSALAPTTERAIAVPLARDVHGDEVRPDAAQAKPFTCVDCATVVVFRRAHQRDGFPVRAHFAHRPIVGCAFSEGEGEQHLRAKQRIVELITAKQPINLIRHCRVCDRAHHQRLPDRVALASLEHRLSSRRADVALLDTENNILAVIEVLETHAVDQEKRIDLAGVRWCEVRASDILGGQEWDLIQDHLLPFTCRQCRNTATHPWTGVHRLEVTCPLPNASAVQPVENCSGCAYFLEATADGVRCWGTAAR